MALMNDIQGALFGHGVLAHSRVWRDGVCVDTDVTPDEMLEVAHDPDSLVWLDLLCPSAEALLAIARDLGLPETAVEDALAPHERAKSRHDSHLFSPCTRLGCCLTSRSSPDASRLAGSRGSSCPRPW